MFWASLVGLATVKLLKLKEAHQRHIPETKIPVSSGIHPRDILFGPSWPEIPASPSPKRETARGKSPAATNIRQSDLLKFSPGKQFLTRKIIYHGQSVENNLISNPSQGEKS